MRLTYTLLCFFALSTVLTSCRKDKNTTDPSVTGSWRIVPETPTADPSYFVFTGQGTAYRLSTDADNYRDVQYAIYK